MSSLVDVLFFFFPPLVGKLLICTFVSLETSKALTFITVCKVFCCCCSMYSMNISDYLFLIHVKFCCECEPREINASAVYLQKDYDDSN